MKKLQSTVLTIAALVGLATPVLVPVTVGAQADPAKSISEGVTKIGGGTAGEEDLTKGITNVVNVLLFILGAIAVIMIIIGGIRYTTSNGDAGNTKAAKDTILYAVVGLVVAILAYAIVNFVIGAFTK